MVLGRPTEGRGMPRARSSSMVVSQHVRLETFQFGRHFGEVVRVQFGDSMLCWVESGGSVTVQKCGKGASRQCAAPATGRQ